MSKKEKLIQRLHNAAQGLKDKADSVEDEASDMREAGEDIEEIVNTLENGDIEGAMDDAECISYSQYDVCHIDMYNMKETFSAIDNIRDEISTVFNKELATIEAGYQKLQAEADAEDEEEDD